MSSPIEGGGRVSTPPGVVGGRVTTPPSVVGSRVVTPTKGGSRMSTPTAGVGGGSAALLGHNYNVQCMLLMHELRHACFNQC